MIGLAATLLLLFNGKIAGISGILGGLLTPNSNDKMWRAIFIIGLILGGVIPSLLFNRVLAFNLDASISTIILAGFLVGFGTRMGSGCTSGHSVCGIGRFSARSIIATLIFIFTAIITVFITHHLADI